MKQLDEITEARKKKRRRYHLRRFVAVLIVVVVVVLFILLVDRINMYTFRSIEDSFRVSFAKKGEYPVLLNSTKIIKVHELKGANAILSESELMIRAHRGSELFRVTHNYSNPMMDVGKNRVLIFDSGSRNYSVYSRTEELYSGESEFGIVSGATAKNGMVAILTRGERSVSQLEVLSNKNYLTYFTWFGANGYPLSCGFSENSSEVYAATLKAERSGISTVFTIIDIDKRQQKAEIVIPGIAMKIFNSGSRYTVVTDKGAFLINEKYQIEEKYLFSRIPILRISKEGKYLAIAFGDNNSSDVNSVVILSDTLKELIILEQVGVVDDIYMSSDRLYLLSSGKIHVILSDGQYVGECDTELKAQKVLLFQSRVYVVMQDRIEQVKIQGIISQKEDKVT